MHRKEIAYVTPGGDQMVQIMPEFHAQFVHIPTSFTDFLENSLLIFQIHFKHTLFLGNHKTNFGYLLSRSKRIFLRHVLNVIHNCMVV